MYEGNVNRMSSEKGKYTYDDIIELAYPFQLKHPRMRQNDRSAQFSAFAALSGYDAAISETARVTDKRTDLDEDAKKELNTKLQIIGDNIAELPLITITYFLPSDKKDGGVYLTVSENLRKIDEYEKNIVTTTGLVIPIGDIYDLKGELFSYLESTDG